MSDRVGQQPGNYRPVRKLGKGSSAKVYPGQYIFCLLIFTLSLLLPISTYATGRTVNKAYQPQSIADFPIVDPLYIYNQLDYLTSNFQSREAGFVANQGHDKFAAYWSQEMVKNPQGFGPQVRLAKASFDPTNSGNALTYTWNFGDGTIASGVGVNHTYSRVGSYTLTLIVTSPTGRRSISKTINVGTQPHTYSNPYSPLGGVNQFNPAVRLPVPDNNLTERPPLAPPVLAPTSTTYVSATATTDISTATATPSTQTTDSTGISLLPLIIAIAIVILSLLVLFVAMIVRRRKLWG